jgi:hypothetical protein
MQSDDTNSQDSESGASDSDSDAGGAADIDKIVAM